MTKDYILKPTAFPFMDEMPWETVNGLCSTIEQMIVKLGDDYAIKDNVAIHKTAIIGHDVNVEAGAIFCNHYNEREDDTVFVWVDGERISTNLHKFGTLVGDCCRIGANAVLSPGTLLKPRTIVKRLELVEQDPQS